MEKMVRVPMSEYLELLNKQQHFNELVQDGVYDFFNFDDEYKEIIEN